MSEPVPIGPVNLSGLSFLVIEDDSFQRWTLERLLTNAGAARTVCTHNGRAALDVLEREWFDILVCDLDMPEVDGIELISRIASGSRVPAVIVCTGQEEALVCAVSDIAQAYSVPLVGSIVKPVTPAKLIRAIGGYAGVAEPRAALQQTAEPLELSHTILERALANGEIQAWFQPKIDMSSGLVSGGEALARWTLPDGTTLLPAQFLPAVEREGLSAALTGCIATQAIAACAAWRRHGVAASVSINVDAASLVDETLVDRLTTKVVEQGLYTADVTLELMESAAAAASPRGLQSLARLRMRGFGLAMDDFGTGYSSMLQLVSVPFTEIKIDRAFVKDAIERSACHAVINSCAEIAATLGMHSVAEGVETDAQWALVKKLGCNSAQGWRFGRAMPWAQFMSFARRLRATPMKIRT